MSNKDVGSVLRNRQGVTRVGKMGLYVGGTLLVLAIYLFVPPYFNNWKLGNMLCSVATNSTASTPEQIKLYAVEELSKQGYHLKIEELNVTKEGKIVTISAQYETIVSIPLTGVDLVMSFSRECSNKRM